MELAYEFQMTREQLMELVRNIVDAYELNLGLCQSAGEALEATQDATISSFDEQAARYAAEQSHKETRH